MADDVVTPDPRCLGCAGTGECRIIRQCRATTIECPVCWERRIDIMIDHAIEEHFRRSDAPTS